VIFEEFDYSVDREPVNMNIKDVHENGNLYTLFFQVFGFEGFFHDHDFPVGRGEDRVILHDNVPVGETEKVYHQEVQNSADDQYRPENNDIRDEGIHEYIDESKEYECFEQ